MSLLPFSSAPATSAKFVDLTSNQTIGGSKTFSSSILFSSNNTLNLGSTTDYLANLYSTNLYLNSTAYLGGSTAGQIAVTGNLSIATSTNASLMIGTTTAPTSAYMASQYIYSSGTFPGGNGINIVAATSGDPAGFSVTSGSDLWQFSARGGGVFSFYNYNGTTWSPAVISMTVSNVTLSTNLTLGTVGNKLNIATGTNASIGTAVLVAGTVTVSTTAVTAGSIIMLTRQVTGGTVGELSVGTITAGTSFVINSASATDTSTVGYLIIN